MKHYPLAVIHWSSSLLLWATMNYCVSMDLTIMDVIMDYIIHVSGIIHCVALCVAFSTLNNAFQDSSMLFHL